MCALPGLGTLDPPISPPSTPAEIFRHDDIMTAWDVGLRIVYVLVLKQSVYYQCLECFLSVMLDHRQQDHLLMAVLIILWFIRLITPRFSSLLHSLHVL